MRYIVCNLSLFSLHQKICLIKDNGDMEQIAEANVKTLPEAIADACYTCNTNQVRLFGGGEVFAKNLANEIKTASMMKYNNHSIEIEVE